MLNKLMVTFVIMASVTGLASVSFAGEPEKTAVKMEPKDALIFIVRQIARCEQYDTGAPDYEKAPSRWCVDDAVKTATVALRTFSADQDNAVNTLKRISSCSYYPSLNSRPYSGVCVDQLVDIAASLVK